MPPVQLVLIHHSLHKVNMKQAIYNLQQLRLRHIAAIWENNVFTPNALPVFTYPWAVSPKSCANLEACRSRSGVSLQAGHGQNGAIHLPCSKGLASSFLRVQTSAPSGRGAVATPPVGRSGTQRWIKQRQQVLFSSTSLSLSLLPPPLFKRSSNLAPS